MTEIYALDIDWDFILHLADPESVKKIQAERLTVEVLEDPIAAEVYEWQLGHIREHGSPASASVLEDEFPDITFEDPQAVIGDLIQRLRLRYAKNKGQDAIRQVTRISKENPTAVGTEMLRLGKEITDVSSERGTQFGTGDISRAMDVYNKKLLRGPGPTLGYKELDDHFHGIQGLTFLIAAPKQFKSWLVVNAVVEGVMEGKFPYLYSLELPAEDTHWRILSMAAGVPYWKYERGCQSPNDIKLIHTAHAGLDEMGVFKVEKPPPESRGAQVLVEKALSEGATSIFIDQLQYVENSKGVNLGSLNETGAYWEVLSMLRDYSDTIPIFIVHQFNRSVMKSTEMPDMQQAKGTAAIEETAHLQLGLWANKEMRNNNILEVGTLASRSYAYKRWHLSVELSRGCEISMIEEVTDED